MRRAAALVLAIVVGGCDAFAPEPPDWVVNRQPLPECASGVVEADSPEGEAGQRCVLDAYRMGRGAELVTSGRMESGAPMRSYLRVHENGVIEVFRNLGIDPGAPGAWERMRCETLVPTEEVGDPLGGIFTLEDCEMLPVP